MRTAPDFLFSLARFAFGAFLSLGLFGCGSEPTPAPRTGPPAATTAATVSATKATNQTLVAKSVFHTGAEAGREPFFPKSNQDLAKNNETTSMRTQPTLSYLKLLGIRTGTTRPLALINRTTLAPGEEGDVPIVISNQAGKAAVQKVSVRCLEIRQDSVLISIAGEEGVKELRMAQRK